MRQVFRFKSFSINDEDCAMRLGTDAVLLGAWACPRDAARILDIGTGCGILALMMAQRSNAFITAIDVHLPSIVRAEENFRQSPWPEKLLAVHASIQSFVPGSSCAFDLIVSNPPFFGSSLLPPLPEKQLSKHDVSLTISDLLEHTDRLLGIEGRLAVVLPIAQEQAFLRLAVTRKLFLQRRLAVVPKTGKPANRVLIECGREPREPVSDSLLIRKADGAYATEYKELTMDFYLFLIVLAG